MKCTATMHPYGARSEHTALRLAGLLLVLAALTAPSSQAQISINRTSGSIHYISTKFSTNNVGGLYAAYKITNAGAAQADVWVKADNFTGGVVTLAPNEDGVVQLGALGSGQTKMAYFYLSATTATAVPQAHTVTVYDTRPDLPVATALATAPFTLTEVATSISAAANKVDVVLHGPDPGTLGGVITMTVEGRTGTVGAGDNLEFSAASQLSWPASTYHLFSSVITFLNIQGSNCGSTTLYTVADSLHVQWNTTSCYRAVYKFYAIGTTSTNTAVSPIVHVASGTQIKHTDASGFASLAPIKPVDNKVTLAKFADQTTISAADTVTFTLRLTSTASNAGCPASEPTCNDVSLADFDDVLPTTPDSPTYVAGTSSFAGSSIDDPSISGSTLTWVGSFTVPAGGTADLTYDVSIPSTEGDYVNTAVGHVGSAQIDTTLLTTDNAKPTETVTVSIVFPVELTSFDVLLDGRDAVLRWATASETNNAGFEIQRLSKGDDHWDALGWIDGHGTTLEAQHYTYRVDGLEPGRYAFRLKQIDYDGTFEFSPEVEIIVEMAERFLVEAVYPNPFNPQAQFRFAVSREQPVRVELYDVLGRRVRVLYAGTPPTGQLQTVRIDGADLPSGLYLVRVVGEAFTQTQKVTLIK